MKDLILTIVLVGITSALSVTHAVTYAQSPQNKQGTKPVPTSVAQQARAMRRAQRQATAQAADQQAYNQAKTALTDKNWVLTANNVYGPDGGSYVVSGITNFIQFVGNTVYLQLAFNDVVNGPNGLGGITLQGSPYDVIMQIDDKGNITYNFDVYGQSLNADVQVSVNANNNYASATVYPNFSSNSLTFSGYLVPSQGSGIYKSGFFSP